MPWPTARQIADGNYDKWDGNTAFEKQVLRDLGLPEDYHPTPQEGYRIMSAWLDDQD